jgi:(2S)-methylsuccinyl-CoA dehydrogenase
MLIVSQNVGNEPCTSADGAAELLLAQRISAFFSRDGVYDAFDVEKPATISATDHHHFAHTQESGGTVEGHAIPTVGYRGMHSFSVSFDNYFVPLANRVGAEGQGFALQMEGFAGGRIQTAARAVGVMEAAFRRAIQYTSERRVFGSALKDYPLPCSRLVRMAATIMASRRLSYDVALMMDRHEGQMEASLVKLISCKDAEWVTREAMQIHGGIGYSRHEPFEHIYRHHRRYRITEGAEEIQMRRVAQRMFKFGQPRREPG